MIAPAEPPNGDNPRKPGGDRRKLTAGPDTPALPATVNRSADLPSLSDFRIRSNANRLAKMAEAGEIAANRLPVLLEQINKLMTGRKRLSARDLAAIGKLQLAIAMAPDTAEQKPQQHLHLHGGGSIGPNGEPSTTPQAIIDDAEYIEFIAARGATDHVQSCGAGPLGNGWKVGALSAPSIIKSPTDGPGGRATAG